VPVALGTSVWYFTRHQKKVFSSETVVYTGIASGYSLNGNNKADFFATSNAFDNLLTLINSRETKEDVAISLLATHLFCKKHEPALLSWDSYSQLQKLVPAAVRNQLVKPTLEETKVAVTAFMQSSEDNLVYRVINSDNPYYSINALREINALRISSSDLIKVSYETNDAAICKHTLELLVDIFMKKHRLLREGQTGSVIAYFEREVHEAYRRLDSCEQVFLAFNNQNDIINYYEQTKAVAGEKENLYALNHNLEMERNAEEKSVAKVNNDLKGKVYQTIYGSDVINQREKLADLYNQIAVSEVMSREINGGQKRQLDSLKTVSGNLEKGLQNSIQQLGDQYNTPEGIPVKSVLDEWVKTTLNYEQSKARLSIMDKRKKEFADEYRKFAPLGAMLKKMERQISVAEQEYLELLHSLSLARLTQQNNELTSKLTIVDPPFLPLKANLSKKALMIIIGAFAGFVIVLGILLTNFLLNKTLQQPGRATKKTGIPLLGIYPLIGAGKEFILKSNLRIMQQLLSRITFEKKPYVIGVFSNQRGEGKSTLLDMWHEGLTRMNYSIQRQVWSLGMEKMISNNADIVFIEFPSLDSMIMTKGSVPEMDQSVLICRANRIWTRIDQELLDIFSKTTGTSPLMVLNGVSVEHAEEYIGEVPKKRSIVRSLIKRIAKLEFGNKKVIFKN
jgi:uncharacterized protein involved in exopolysaccharide biosynthesis